MPPDDYELSEEIGGDPLYILHRARSSKDNQKVILKASRSKDHESISLPRLHREFEIGKQLSYDGLIPVLELIEVESNKTLVLSDQGGLPLEYLLSKGRLDIKTALGIASKLAHLLGILHKKGYTHLNLLPRNIWFDETGCKVYLTGMGTASRAPRGLDVDLLPKIIEGSLAYTSPEQTGRTSRVIDYRTDFYAFGVILYEMLTGERPFESNDPLELIHAHVAKRPVPPPEILSIIPKTVFNIVQKLLNKPAELRYQSAKGLKIDLKRCLDELNSNGSVSLFKLGKSDQPARFELPQKLYGRENETRILSSVFEEALHGKPQLLKVFGTEGTGKTALVNNLKQEVLLRNGHFIASKWDELDHLKPYNPAIQIFKDIIHQLLAEAEPHLNSYRNQLKKALGKNMGVLVNLFPEAEAIFGPPENIPELEPKEVQHRLHQCLQTFIKVYSKSRPLVVFYDDLHWVDKTGIEFIKGVFGSNMERILLICGYRDKEVENTHLLWEVFDTISQRGFNQTDLSLRPLDHDGVEQLVVATFRTSPEKVIRLTEMVYHTTSGNPYFVKAFLTSLWEEGAFNTGCNVSENWDTDIVQRVEEPEDMIELTTRRLARLSESVRRIISMAAALGTTINTATLAAICNRSFDQAENDLVNACEKRILIQQGQDYRFEHDQLRKKAYGLIPKNSRAKTHLRIARLLKKMPEKEKIEELFFAIADQYARGITAIRKKEDQIEAAFHFMVAGNKARSNSSFPLAYTYFTNGIKVLRKNSWEKAYDITIGLHNGAAETAFLLADLKNSQQLIETIHNHSKHILDQIAGYEIQMSIAYARRSESEILKLIIKVLQSLGVTIPEDPSPAQAREIMQKVKQPMTIVATQKEQELPPMKDPLMLAAMRLIRKAIPSAGWVDSSLIVLLTGKMAQITLKYGRSPESDLAFILTGNLMCSLFNDFHSGYNVAHYGLSLSEKAGNTPQRAICLLVFHMTVSPWRKHPDISMKGLTQTHSIAGKLGDSITAGYAAYAFCAAGFFSGMPLPDLERQIRIFYREALRNGLERIQGALLNLHHTISTLMGEPELTKELAGGSDVQGKIHEKWAESSDPTVQQLAGTYQMMMHYIFRRHEQAFSMALKINDMPMGSGKGLLPTDTYICLCFMTRHQPNETDKKVYLTQIKKLVKYLHLRAKSAPESYTHRLNLIKAEQLRTQGKFKHAMGCYENAIERARENRFLNEEALTNELAAEFYLDMESKSIAVMYLGQAIAAYKAWGAKAKSNQLLKIYHYLLKSSDDPTDRTTPQTAHQQIVSHDKAGLDFTSIQKAAQALSAELNLAKLITELMKILLQNAAAQRGFLLKEGPGGITIAASASVDESEVKFPLNIALESCNELSRSVVRYVSRTNKTIVHGNAIDDQRFASDPYIQKNKPKSILCIPVMNQGQQVALLYMENNRIQDAFTKNRLTAVKLIFSQTASTIENAQLHENLKQEVNIRRKAERNLRQALDQVAKLKDKLQAENMYLREEIKTSHDFDEIVGESEQLKGALYKIGMVAATHANVLILGETGTGKELVARALHAKSQRKNSSLIKVNCAALPASLIESELFGHEKGAFTGAIEKKIGRFELADKGTIFLDEIGDLPLELQSKLLRVLQENEFERLGSSKTIKVDVRVIAATNRKLEKESKNGKFRSDLYYRLSVFPIELPPLRARKGDIPLLVSHFLKKKQVQLGKTIQRIPQQTMDALNTYLWPGNVRELENVIERAIILSQGDSLDIDESFGASPQAAVFSGQLEHQNLENIERQHILNIIETCGWKLKGKGNAAEQLGLHPSTLHSRMKKLGISRPKK